MSTQYRTSARIDAPIEKVWHVMTDVENMPQWTASMDRVTIEGGGSLGAASTVLIEQPKMPKATWVVDDWQPMTRFAWVNRSPGVRIRADHILTPAEGHRCDAVFTVQFDGPLARVIAALAMKRTRAYVDLELAGLKTRCEASISR